MSTAKMLLSIALVIIALIFSNPPSVDVAFIFFHFPSRLFLLLNDKNYVFLLCNGIIIILAKSYWVFNSFHDDDHHEFQSYCLVEQHNSASLPPRPIFSSTNAEIPVQQVLEAAADNERRAAFVDFSINTTEAGEELEQEPEEKVIVLVDGTVQEEEEEMEVESYDQFSMDENDRFEEADNMDECWFIEEEEEEQEHPIASLSTEELNRKFDEFIRKMKEEIRIEARTQLVMV